MLRLLILALFAVSLNADATSLNIDLDASWGPECNDDTSIKPYQIQFDREMVNDLKYRINNLRELTPPLEGQGFQYGANTNEVKKWANYLANEYNFTERVEYLNQYPQYVTYIQNLKIHFIRITPEVPEGKVLLPVLLMHGWPGSVREFYSALPLLTEVCDSRDFVLEIIAPSLPGFGFSDRATRSGMGAVEIGVIMRNLMHRLGHKQFYIQGGDWGSIIGFNMATVFPEEVLGYISNMGLALTEEMMGLVAAASINPSMLVSASEEDRLYPLSSYLSFLTQESGYFHIQATKPYTLGVGLADSPVGLLAWMLQHIATGNNLNLISEQDGGLSTFTFEQLLDNMMFYWAENKIISASLPYAETANLRNWHEAIFAIQTPVPTYIIQAKREVFYTPPTALKTKYTNLVNIKVLENGGHFLALELPTIFAEIVLNAMEEIRSFREIKCK